MQDPQSILIWFEQGQLLGLDPLLAVEQIYKPWQISNGRYARANLITNISTEHIQQFTISWVANYPYLTYRARSSASGQKSRYEHPLTSITPSTRYKDPRCDQLLMQESDELIHSLFPELVLL